MKQTDIQRQTDRETETRAAVAWRFSTNRLTCTAMVMITMIILIKQHSLTLCKQPVTKKKKKKKSKQKKSHDIHFNTRNL